MPAPPNLNIDMTNRSQTVPTVAAVMVNPTTGLPVAPAPDPASVTPPTVASAALQAAGGATWPGGRGTVIASGTFGGATTKLQVQNPTTTDWVDVGAAATLTAPGMFGFELPPGVQVRMLTSGGTSPAIVVNALGHRAI